MNQFTNQRLWALLPCFLFSWSAGAVAPGAISSATAGSGRASVEASESPFLNPATIPYLKGYFFTSSYNSTSMKSTDTTFSLTDTMKDTLIPTSLGYSQSTMKNPRSSLADSQIKSQDIRLAMGERVGRRFSAGLAAHHKSDRAESNTYAQTNMILASAWSMNDSLTGALVFDDLLGNDASVPEDLRFKTKTSLAFSYNYRKFVRAKVDLITGGNNSFNKPTILTGVESFMNRWMVLRIGLGRNAEEAANIYSAGFGFQLPKFGLHYAYMQSQEDENFTRHTVDLAIPVW